MTFDSSYFVGPETEPDKYRLVMQVPGGGEAELWKAELPIAGTLEPVAVKILRTERAEQFDSWRSRWAEQAELLHFIRHPGVVGVREHFEGSPLHAGGQGSTVSGRSLYLIMNWVAGRDLREWVPMHQDLEGFFDGLRYLLQIADVLDWLHSGKATPSSRPVVHGDVTPANIIVTPEGQAVLVDFGLFRLATQTSSVAEGTRGYMAPEVLSQGTYSPASDRYGFGAVSYFVLTGQQPPTDLDELHAGLDAVPFIANQEGLANKLMLMFHPDPAMRPTAGEWARLLRTSSSSVTIGDIGMRPIAPGTTEVMSGLSPSEPDDAPKRSRRGLATILIAVLILIIAGVVYGLSKGGQPSNSATGSTGSHKTVPPVTTSQPTTSTQPTTPPTSSSVIQSQSQPGTVQLLDSANSSYVTQSSMGSGLAFAINGQQYSLGAYGYGEPNKSPPAEIDFNLSRSFKTFTGRIGVIDSSPATCTAEIQVIADGRTVVDDSFSLGQSQDLSLDVTDVLRLQVIVVKSAPIGSCQGGLGNPTVTS